MMKCFEEYLSDEEGVTYKLEMKKMDFDNIITQLQGDQIDVGISGFTYDSKRKVEWSDPYLGSSQVAVIPKDSDIASTADLEGKSLVAQTGATGEALMDEQNYIIAKKGNTDMIEKMNTCIKKFLASDDYAKLCKKYDLSPLETK